MEIEGIVVNPKIFEGGRPIKGGFVEFVLQRASTHVPGAYTELGRMTLVPDYEEGDTNNQNNVAKIWLHIHNTYWSDRPNPDRLRRGINNQMIGVHLHPDGTIHLHDIVRVPVRRSTNSNNSPSGDAERKAQKTKTKTKKNKKTERTMRRTESQAPISMAPFCRIFFIRRHLPIH